MKLTPKELIEKLATHEGPCFRLCAYCPDDYNTAEVKECVEEMIRKIYVLKETNDDLLKELIKVRRAYKDKTGKEYKGDDET